MPCFVFEVEGKYLKNLKYARMLLFSPILEVKPQHICTDFPNMFILQKSIAEYQ